MNDQLDVLLPPDIGEPPIDVTAFLAQDMTPTTPAPTTEPPAPGM
jgi:hypothetical protein